ncbi:MAG: AAA family ATPase [Dictyoglomus sp. NZ13-RE01]|nr:MAG: AAA family ATPase [Dictyoglomus sp. NZ13-RE01]
MIDIEFNEQFKKALDLMENTNKNVFITGKAGTGKSTLLNYFRSITKKNIVVLAPTGVSALNVNGETIHSFFGFKPNVTLQSIRKLKDKEAKIYKEIDTIVIDEISMVRADLLDCVDYFLRLNGKSKSKPFGGIQMIFIGDLYQLPPVVTSKEKELFTKRYKSQYFFDSDVFKDLPVEFIELEKVYRQRDEKFINLLNEIRNNTIIEESLKLLNSRVRENFEDSDYTVYLTPLNETANKINMEKLNSLKGKLYEWNAYIEGEFDENSYPTDAILYLKKGAQVMMLNNDSKGRWVNGSIGKVVDIKRSKNYEFDIIKVQFPDNRVEEVYPFTWEIFHYRYNDDIKMIETEVVGSFTQYPLRLAWAVTIHKSQGKTFDKVVIDLERGVFAPGQLYVALSRCTSFEGIILKKPVKKSYILLDKRIVNFLTNFQYKLSERDIPLEEKIKIIEKAIKENKLLSITYLKPNDEKSRRIIKPYEIGEFEYNKKKFLGVSAYCHERKEDRVFRIDRILEIDIV